MVSAARVIAEYSTTLDFSKLPSRVIQSAKEHFLDTLGVTIAGSVTPWSKIIADFCVSQSSNTEATILGRKSKVSADLAALSNGTMAHSLDYDDDPGVCHIGAVVVPATLAAAEKFSADGEKIIEAVVIGYDVVGRVEEAVDGEALFTRGFHPTSVCGVFGAATVATKILGLDLKKTIAALGIAGSFASGVMEFLSDGSMIKRVHPGWAAKGGIIRPS